MAEFQWWLLLVGLVAGGGLVAIVSMDARRHDDDLGELERRAEATWIADRLATPAEFVDAQTVELILATHREYLSLTPPDHFVLDGVNVDLDGRPLVPEPDALDGDPDEVPDDIGDDRRRGADEHLPPAREQETSTGEEAYAGADGEQRRD